VLALGVDSGTILWSALTTFGVSMVLPDRLKSRDLCTRILFFMRKVNELHSSLSVALGDKHNLSGGMSLMFLISEFSSISKSRLLSFFIYIVKNANR